MRNFFLLVCSYFFYGMWDWRFLGLIVFSSMVDYIIGAMVGKVSEERKSKRKLLLAVSVIVNLGFLAYFKYANFFIDSLVNTFTFFGEELSTSRLSIILPVGISFYTFQSLSYTIDIYNKKFEPTKDIIAFFAFISFFPQLVAGPIERAKNLLPQFSTLKKFDYNKVREGVVEIIIGLLLKMVIADRLAIYVDSIFESVSSQNDQMAGLPIVLGLIFFAFQLYIDFSAYSQIAIGTAKIFGFQLNTNFRRPYISHSFSNFWERWHISLSQWMRDYLYIPLGGSRVCQWKIIRNVLVVFAFSGLWHGASWNFVIWGLINALFIIILDPVLNKFKIKGMFAAIIVFSMWTLSLIFFRAEGITAALTVVKSLGFGNVDQIVNFGLSSRELYFTLISIGFLMLYELVLERIELKGKNYINVLVVNHHITIRWAIYIILIFAIIFFGIYATNNDNSFIYFQF